MEFDQTYRPHEVDLTLISEDQETRQINLHNSEVNFFYENPEMNCLAYVPDVKRPWRQEYLFIKDSRVLHALISRGIACRQAMYPDKDHVEQFTDPENASSDLKWDVLDPDESYSLVMSMSLDSESEEDSDAAELFRHYETYMLSDKFGVIHSFDQRTDGVCIFSEHPEMNLAFNYTSGDEDEPTIKVHFDEEELIQKLVDLGFDTTTRRYPSQEQYDLWLMRESARLDYELEGMFRDSED